MIYLGLSWLACLAIVLDLCDRAPVLQADAPEPR